MPHGSTTMKNKVLVVDDDLAICELLTDVLSEHVFDVRSCQLAHTALQTLQQEPDIALVLLDLMLPDMSGLLLLQQIRMQFPDLPVIMLTGLATESDMVVGLEMGQMITSRNRLCPELLLHASKRFCVGRRWAKCNRVGQ